MRRELRTRLVAAVLLMLAGFTAAADKPPADGLVPSPEKGWPQWRGPRRDAICDEKGLLQSWPEGGPKVLWKSTGLGRGYSSPIISGGTMYITGDVGDDLVIFALDMKGKPTWRAVNGRSWIKPWGGARASCAISEGRLYHMNAHGRTVCLDAATGKELWAVDVLKRFGGENIRWALSECLLIDGPRVIVTPGGRKGLMAALDKKTGETVWASESVPGEKAGYASPILFTYAGRRFIAGCSSKHAFGVDADTGKLLWKLSRPTRYEVIAAAPVYCGGGRVFVISPDGRGGAMYQVNVDGKNVSAAEKWVCELDNVHGGTLLAGGVLYGAGHMRKGWGAVDVKTGKMLYTTTDLPMGSAIHADGRLYCLSEKGEAALLKPTETGFEFEGRFRLAASPEKRPDVWPHPVILDGRLYLRYHETLHCYDVRRKQGPRD